MNMMKNGYGHPKKKLPSPLIINYIIILNRNTTSIWTHL
jgi:hypothetical protein